MASERSWDGVVRGLKVGSLLLFTALTTTACYGGPKLLEAPIDDVTEKPGMLPRFNDPEPTSPGPSPEVPEYKVPSQAGTAYLFWTVKGEKTRSTTLKLVVSQAGNGKLSLFSLENATFSLGFDLPEEGIPEPIAGVRQALPMESMDAIGLVLRDPTTRSEVFSLTPDSERPTGTLQISELDETVLAGVLILELREGTLQLYFRSHHSVDEAPDATPTEL